MGDRRGIPGPLRSAIRVCTSRPWLAAPLGLVGVPGLLPLIALMSGAGTVALTAQPHVVAAASTRVVRDALAEGCPFDAGIRIEAPVGLAGVVDRSNVVRADPPADRLKANDAVAERVRDLRHLQPEVRTLFATAGVAAEGEPGPAVPLRLMTRPAAADHVQMVSGGAGAVLLPDTVAKQLGVQANETVDLTFNGLPAPVVVSGIFRDLATTPRDRYWCSLTTSFESVRNSPTPPSVAFLPEEQLIGLLAGANEPVVASTWEYAPEPRVTGREAVPLSTELEAVAAEARNPASALGSTLKLGRGRSTLGAAVAIAAQTATTLNAFTGSLALATGIIVLLVMWSAGGAWAERRWIELVNLAVRGVPPGLLAVRAAVEVAPVVAAGSAAGAAVSLWGLRFVGPRVGPDWETVRGACRIGAVGWAVSVSLVALAAWTRCRRLGRDPGLLEPTAGRSVPWEMPALVIAGTALFQMRGKRSAIVSSGGRTEVDVLLLVLPIALIAGLSGLVGRGALTALGRGKRIGPGMLPVPIWLARRRLVASGARAVAAFATAAVSLGMLVYASALVTSLTATMRAKSTIALGAEQTVTVSNPLPLPAGAAWSRSATRVIRTTERADPAMARRPATVLGVDRESFGRGAAWDPTYATTPLKTLLGRLQPRPGQPLPALATRSLPADAIVRVAGADRDIDVRIRVVGRVKAFPGQRDDEAVVVDREGLLGAGGTEVAEVWTRSRSPAVFTDLEASGARPAFAIIIDRSSLQPLTAAQLWSVTYLRIAGAAVGAGTLCALLLRLADGGGRHARSARLLRRVGLGRAEAWSAYGAELAALVLGGAVVGAGIAALTLRWLAPRLDPVPGSASGFILRFDTSLLPVVLPSGVGVIALLAWYAVWRERRAAPDAPLVI